MKWMGFSAGCITSHGDLLKSARERPPLDLLHQTPAYAMAALIRGHNHKISYSESVREQACWREGAQTWRAQPVELNDKVCASLKPAITLHWRQFASPSLAVRDFQIDE